MVPATMSRALRKKSFLGKSFMWITFSHEVGEGDQAQLVEQTYACFTLALGVFSYQTTCRQPPPPFVMGWPPGVTRSVYHLKKSNTAPTTGKEPALEVGKMREMTVNGLELLGLFTGLGMAEYRI